jgi:hypothetical protein
MIKTLLISNDFTPTLHLPKLHQLVSFLPNSNASLRHMATTRISALFRIRHHDCRQLVRLCTKRASIRPTGHQHTWECRTPAMPPILMVNTASYWASFIVSGDPNAYSHEGSARWDTYTVGTSGSYQELVVNRPTDGGPKMEDERTAIRMEQCAWWRDEQRAKRLNK